ncbi:MAG: phosphoenolpyruvate mutase [Defluviitaleaceae bacterium]|nr:phosphoenolpyruvate mutase [Defluviitaleaceae bacterium]
MTKREKFRKLLNHNKHFFLMEAHDGLSSKIVEETGFSAIWASGLSITASLGVRDNNEISYTQLLDVLEYMNDATSLPILVDGDTGYGNFNNASVLLRKLEERGIAAVCIEDKKFPKTNSFLEDSMDALADPLEFAGKIRAMKAAQSSPDFTVVARLESFNVGAGLDDAIKRARIYVEAGADALLVHSKRSDSKDIDDFLSSFDMDVPIFLVPTKYYTVPVNHLTKDIRVRGIIWANQSVRACVSAMQSICKQIFNEGSIANAEESIASVSEIFRLQRHDEYVEMEKKYLPPGTPSSAIILAAGSPGKFGIEKPKALISINGQSLLEHQITALTSVGIANKTIVRGYKKEHISMQGYSYVDNDKWQTTDAMYSLSLASKGIVEPYLVLYSDVFFKRYLLHNLILFSNQTDADIILVCVKENYIFSGSLVVDNSPDYLGNNDTALITGVSDSSYGDTEKTVYFSGLMMVKNHEGINNLLECKDIDTLSSRMLFSRALEYGMKIAAIIASTDAIVDINTVQDLMKVR